MTSSSKPYLVRALNQWMSDSDLTPYVLVNANFPGSELPLEYVKDGQIVFDISTTAVKPNSLMMNNYEIEFEATFSQVPKRIYIPMAAVAGIYPKEDITQGIFFPEETPPDRNAERSQPIRGKPNLKIVE